MGTLKKKAIPIFLLNGRGYDYILSNLGIELILPDYPDELANGNLIEFEDNVFDLYSIRKTGRYALYLPPEHDNVNTGPNLNPKISKVFHESAQHRTVRFIENDNNVEEIIFDRNILNSYVSLVKKSGNEIGLKDETLDILLQNTNNLRCQIRESRPTRKNGGVSFDLFLCTSVFMKKWQIPGSVFRSIAFEMQKIKARIWLELNKSPQRNKDLYDFDSDDGCRRLFERNLELSLPPSTRMQFAGLTGIDNKAINPGPNDFGYKKNEIYIHNDGIALPKVEARPNTSTILTSWKNGVAANPLFTDSTTTS